MLEPVRPSRVVLFGVELGGGTVRLIERSLAPRVSVEIRVVDGASHFSFMNVPPPQTTETLADRDAFLTTLAEEVGRFVTR